MSAPEPLPNPERDWERKAELRALDREEILQRIGPTDEPCELLSGGHANVNMRIGTGRVLRVYRRDTGTLRKEQALLGLGWKSFRVPAVLASGEDFLLLEYVPHAPLQGSAAHGEALGLALAEVHARGFSEAGLLGPTLDVVTPFHDVFAAFHDHLRSQLDALEPTLRSELYTPLSGFIERHAESLRAWAGGAVLLHGDFKASNLHDTKTGLPLVLDWEFAYAGPALLDVGQLLRWAPPEPFVEAFAASYQEHGGHLPEDWRRQAEVLDLFNLVGLLARAAPGSKRAVDVRRRILTTLGGPDGD
ncbi:phosphotransferase family protein [Pyxidicoccus sp. MSG2]|uniref:phosphotransferase family protein n=1 Tax=Pyxidicoccus sp. MSG2 TaxID=2996790 RepID=UPI00226EEFFD|nr:aminoglycoside phosphotransferase family protein [Pyxidicoccus sp. MSG2]MCY1021673.1 aminoglycoside phosphotransferase family protein [Pyxidicoccus sp. MSG2]